MGMRLAWLAVGFAGPLALANGGPVTVAHSGGIGLQLDEYPVVASPVPAGHPAARRPAEWIESESAQLQLKISETFEGRNLLIAQAATGAPAVDVAPEGGLKFEIRQFQVDGNTLLQPDGINRALAPFTGKQKDFGDVQRALEALQEAYHRQGYTGVQVTLPEQELEKGEVRFVVIETKIAKISVDGNEYFSPDNVRSSVPTLVSGQTPNSDKIAASLRVANENPAKYTTVLLKSAEREGEIDATIRVADVDPKRYSISFDNTGNSTTGAYRLGFAYQHANLWDRDHVLTAQYLTSPENPNKVTTFGVGYRIPFYAIGDSVDLVAGYSNVNSGTVQDLFTVSGQGAIYALRYNQSLPRLGELEQKLTYGFDYRAYQNVVQPIGQEGSIIPDITIHPVSMTYSGLLRENQREFSYFAQISQNIPGGSDGTDKDFKNVRFESRAGYRIYRLGASLSGATPQDWQYRVNFTGQYTEDVLVPGEQFGLGGAESIRGFGERYVSKDRGYRTSFEVYSPDMGKKLGTDNLRLRLLTFYDTGRLGITNPQPGEIPVASLDSMGFGIRLNYKSNLIIKLDYAQVLHDSTQIGSASGRTHANRLHAAIAIVF